MKIKNLGNLNMVEEEHLGGFIIETDPATFTPTLWNYLLKKLNPKSSIDVGCGMGYYIKHIKNCVDFVLGVDGSKYVKENSQMKDFIVTHDFTKGKLNLKRNFDLGWSCEFVEHVEEKYLDNFMDIFAKCKYVAITYADVGQDGYNHVNCQPKKYWLDIFEKYGLIYDEEFTVELRKVTEMDAKLINPIYKNNHFMLRGLFFKNKNIL